MKHARLHHRLLIGLLLVLSWQGSLRAAISEPFESAEPTLQVIDQDAAFRLEEQARTSTHVHGGNAAEYVRLAAAPGTKVVLAQPIPAARVIDEFAPELWVRADRVGLQMVARVVLPRSVDPRTGRPVLAYVGGDLYQEADTWRQLRIDKFSKRLAEQVRILRQKNKDLRIDPLEAYVDYIGVNVHPGQGVINVWFDDLSIAGYAEAPPMTVAAADRQPAPPGGTPADLQASRLPDIVRTQVPVRVQGTTVMVGGRPFFARIIEHNGESFSWLQSLGFNAVKLAATPTAAELREADTLGLWLIAPPPPTGAEAVASDRVLAWDLGSRLSALDVPAVHQLAARLRANPRCPAIVGSGERDIAALAYELDVLLHDRPSLGTSAELAERAAWLTTRRRLARSQQPFWVGLATEIADEQVEQLALFGYADAAPLPQFEQLRLLAYQAIAAGARGLCYRSHSRLDQRDEAARIRTAMVRALNAELAAIVPWAAAGQPAGRVETSDPRVVAHVLKTDRARLLIAIQQAAQQQFVVGPVPDQRRVSFYLQGVPITDQVFRFERGQLEPLRAAGGNRSFSSEDVDLVTLALLTHDHLAVNHLNRELNNRREASARLQLEIAQAALSETQHVVRQIDAAGHRVHQATQWLLDAEQLLRRSEQLQTRGDPAGAYRFTSQANNRLRRVRQKYWEQAAMVFPSPISSPLCTTFATLPRHYELAARGAQWSGNVLAAGQCEDLNHLVQSGWHQYRESEPQIEAKVEFSGADTHGGRSALHLTARRTVSGEPVDGWPIRIVSAPVSARRGQLVRINGWAKVPEQVSGSQDGLMIYETSGGPALAERIPKTRGWQEFTLYRTADRDGPLTVTFALTGLGEAWLDDVTVALAD